MLQSPAQRFNDVLRHQRSVLEQALAFNGELMSISTAESRREQSESINPRVCQQADLLTQMCQSRDVVSQHSDMLELVSPENTWDYPGREGSKHSLLSAPSAILEPLLRSRQSRPEDGVDQNGETGVSFAPPNPMRRASIFQAPGGIKAALDETFQANPDDQEDFYKDSGCWQAVVRNHFFCNMILCCIILNTIWMAVDTDFNKARVLNEAPLFCQIMDHMFTFIFFVEILIRFMAFADKKSVIRDTSFAIDFVLVALMVWENWMLVLIFYLLGHEPFAGGSRSSSTFRIFRIFRVLRIARAARLFNSIPELLILAKAMLVAVRSVISILVLLGLAIYIFALIFTQMLSGSPIASGNFDTVPQSMNFLLLTVLCGPDFTFICDLLEGGWLYYVAFLLFVFLSQLTMMNMLIGILCEVVSSAAESENVAVFEKELTSFVDALARETDTDGSNSIDKSEFDEMISNPLMVEHLVNLGLDVEGIMHRAPYVFSSHEELTYREFAHFMSQFRGGQPSKVKDVMDLTKYLHFELWLLKAVLDNHVEHLDQKIEAKLSQLPKAHNVRNSTSVCTAQRLAPSIFWDGAHHPCVSTI